VLTLASLSLVVLALGSLAAPAAAQPGSIDRDDAIAIVTQSQLGGSLDGVRLYVLPRSLPAGEAIADWKRDVFVAPASGWLVFVDRYPGANWEHPCWYFFVDETTGDVQRFDSMTPPLLQPELFEITDFRDNPPPGVSEAALERYRERLRSLPKPDPSRGPAYAFIISGGANQSNNHIRYWNDCAFIYTTLVEYYGYEDENIRVCISDGTNPAPDRSDGTNSPPDLDGDGDDDIEYPATLQYIDLVFDELAATLTAGDQLFIFTTDHGGQESGWDCYLNLWNLEELRDDQLAAYVDALPCQTVICTFEQCYSGGMIDDLEGDGRVVATACRWDEVSWAMAPHYIYDAFVYHWTCAVAWQHPTGEPVDADTNNDGNVSMHEAFIYAEEHDQANETPQYSSTPANLGDIIYLFGDLEGVYLTLDDVIIDDDDNGASQGNGNGVIEFGETIELSVALHNMGLTDATGVVGTLATTSPWVNLITGMAAYGDIPSGSTVTNDQPFVFGVDAAVPNGAALELALGITEPPDELSLDLSAMAPAYLVGVREIDDSSGDGDGMADPGEEVTVTLKIENTGGADSPDLTAVLESDGYFTVAGTPHAVGAIPIGESAIVAGFVVQISPACPEVYSGQLTLGLSGPGSYSVGVDFLFMVGPWFDDAETDMGWTLGAPGDDASTGVWVRLDPTGTRVGSHQVQPEDDHTPAPGVMCFVTGNAASGYIANYADVDDGRTTLLSPVFDLEGATLATLSYWRWYTNDLGNAPGQDWWDVDVTADGTNWVHLEHTQESANSWTEHSFDLGAYIPFTSTVRIRFVASDLGLDSLVEAAVDDITVLISRPPTAGVAASGLPAVTRLRLGECVPNPMNPSTSIPFELPSAAPVSIKIYDVGGRLVRSLLERSAMDAGAHTIRWDGRRTDGQVVGSGIYYIRLETLAGEETGSVTLLR
jgi:hypothetical protein